MVDTLVLLPLLLVIMLFVGAAVTSKSLILGAAGGLTVFGYISVKSGNDIFLGFWLLSLFFMTMGTGVYLTRTVIGDTA